MHSGIDGPRFISLGCQFIGLVLSHFEEEICKLDTGQLTLVLNGSFLSPLIMSITVMRKFHYNLHVCALALMKSMLCGRWPSWSRLFIQCEE
jgi:hypothetical protein